MTEKCPCGSGESYELCCGKYHTGKSVPETAEQLMRSRYSAYVMKLADYIVDTTHPKKRQPMLRDELLSNFENVQWIRLEIVRTSLGKAHDKTGKVEFKAFYIAGGTDQVLHELSRFKKHSGRWFYFDGVFEPE